MIKSFFKILSKSFSFQKCNELFRDSSQKICDGDFDRRVGLSSPNGFVVIFNALEGNHDSERCLLDFAVFRALLDELDIST